MLLYPDVVVISIDIVEETAASTSTIYVSSQVYGLIKQPTRIKVINTFID